MRWVPLVALACLMVGLPALSVGGAAAQGPPTRFYGKVTINGERPPLGTKVEGYVEGALCGEGEVRELGDPIGVGYVVDVLAESFKPGCAKEGASVSFKVGGLDAGETGEFHSGTFVQVDLTAQGQIATPTPPPTPLPRESPAPGATSPSPGASAVPSPGASPDASAAPGASPSPEASPGASASPSPGTSASPDASPGASPDTSASPTAGASPDASAAPSTASVSARASDDDDGGVSPAVWLLPLIVVLAGAGGALYVYRMRRRGA